MTSSQRPTQGPLSQTHGKKHEEDPGEWNLGVNCLPRGNLGGLMCELVWNLGWEFLLWSPAWNPLLILPCVLPASWPRPVPYHADNWQYQDGGPAGRGWEEGAWGEGKKRPGLSLGLELARGDRVNILLG